MRLLPLLGMLLAAAPTQGAWTVDPSQALVTVDAAPFSAFSHRLDGVLREADDGLKLTLRVPVRSLTTGDPAQDRALPRDGELALELRGAGPPRQGTLDLEGTVTFRDVSRPVRLRMVVSRTDAALFGHALLVVHLREFAWPLPAGMRDAARIELDAALRPERRAAAQR